MSDLIATLHDGTTISIHVTGDGPAVLLPVRSERFDAETAEQMRAWGADPDAGPTLIDGLARTFRVIAADYEAHRLAEPAAETLAAEAVAKDLLAIADAAGAERFAYYGYSWLALSGLQLAIRTDRLWALAMGGYPPLDGPYEGMLAVTRKAHELAMDPPPAPIREVEPGNWDSVGVQASEAQTRQFVTLYESLVGFDDAAIQPDLYIPRLAFAGADDTVAYGPAWGNLVVEIGEPLIRNREALVALGWDVRILPGLDHIGAMRADTVLPILIQWLPTAIGAMEAKV